MSHANHLTSHPMERVGPILALLRGRIVSGEWAVGTRLPTRLQLMQRHRTTKATIDKALGHLMRDGFVETRGREGTFVRQDPPHLTRYAVAFETQPDNPSGWTLLMEAFRKAAAELAVSDRIKVQLLHHVDGHADSESVQQLLADCRCQRLAGVFFTFPPYWLIERIEELRGTPAVAFFNGWPDKVHGIAPRMVDYYDKALAYLAARGRKRVAFLTPGLAHHEVSNLHTQIILPAVARHGLHTRPYWLLPCSYHMRETACFGVQLMMACEQSQRPDALVVLDDHLVEQATSGLLAAGVKVPEQLEVIAHCNYPVKPRHLTPVTFLGYDAKQSLQQAFDLIRDLRHQRKSRLPLPIQPLFEDEYISAHSTPFLKEKPCLIEIPNEDQHEGSRLRG